MKITFLGGADEVGGTSYILEIASYRFLIDAGVRIHTRAGRPKAPDYEKIGHIDAVFLSHAHTDHSGAIPLVNRYLINVPIYMTHASFQLCLVLFRDALKIMQSQEKEDEIPLYSEEEVELTLKNIKQIKFFHSFRPQKDIQVTFFPAGHILGASSIYFESREGSILIAGDYSITNQLAVSGASITASPDIVISESTYGGKRHINRKELEYECLMKLREIIERGGKILIPAFAIGRSQEMLLLIRMAMVRQILPEVSVWVDGMVNAVNLVYESNLWSLPANLSMMIKNNHALFYTRFIKRVNPKERQKLLEGDKPAIFISSSGMLIGGPSVLYANHLLKEAKNALFISGYQDEESPGRRLLELKRGEMLRINNKEIEVKSEIYQFKFSAHADESQIISFVNSLSPKEVVLVHGEDSARKSFLNKFACKNLHLPVLNETLEFKTYKKNIFFNDALGSLPKDSQTIKEFWKECLHNGVPRVSNRDLEERFPDKLKEIETFGGFIKSRLNKQMYDVLSPDKRNRYLERKKRFTELGNLKGKLVIYGALHTKIHLAYCKDIEEKMFVYHLLSTKKGKSKTKVDVMTILHVINFPNIEKLSEQDVLKKVRTMGALVKPKIKPYRSTLLKQSESFTFESAKKMLGVEDVIDEIALMFAIIPVTKKMEDGSYSIISSPEKSEHPQEMEDSPVVLNNNQIQILLREALKTHHLKKTSYKDNTFTLIFDFPDAVDKAKIHKIARSIVKEPLGISISKSVNQIAFNNLLFDYLGPKGKLSIHTSQKRVVISHCKTSVTKEFQESFLKKTGFVLEEKKSVQSQQADKGASEKAINQQSFFRLVKNLVPKAFQESLKIGLRDGKITLKADFPDALIKNCPSLIKDIGQATSRDVLLNPFPNTFKMTEIVCQRIDLKKNPSINLKEKTITIATSSVQPDIIKEIHEITGFKVISTY